MTPVLLPERSRSGWCPPPARSGREGKGREKECVCRALTLRAGPGHTHGNRRRVEW